MPETSTQAGVQTRIEKSQRATPRIAFLTNVIPPYHKPILQRLTERYPGFLVLLSTPMESNRPWKLEWDGLNVVVQKNVTLNRRWRHPKGFSEPLYVHFPVDTIRQLNDFKADVVISGEMGTRTLLAAFYRQRHPHSRLIVWAEIAESTEQGRGVLRQALRRVLHRAVDAFLVTGESGARYLRSLGIADQKIFKIAYTTNVEQFADVPLARTFEQTRRLLFVGQLIERKGLLLFLSALVRWAAAHPGSEVEFVLAGDGPLRTALERFARPANLHLRLLGNVDYDRLPEVYGSSSIFVLPSLADTWAVVVNEALAAGLPVLGSVYAQAVSELVQDGQNGWTFRADAEDEVDAAIEKSLAAGESELRPMRLAARETALRLTPEVVTGMVDRAIAFCLESARRGERTGGGYSQPS